MKALWPDLKGYRAQLVLGPLFKLAEAILELLVPLLMADIIDVGVKTGDVRYIVTHGLAMLGLGAVGLGCALTCQYFAAVCAQGFGRSLRRRLFSRVMALSRSQYGSVGTDSLITRLTSDANQVQTGVNMFIRLAVRAPFLAIGSIVMAFTISAQIGLVFLVSTPLIVLVLYAVMRKTVPMYGGIQAGQDGIARLAGEHLEGVRVIRAFGRQQAEVQAFDKAGASLAAATVRVGVISAALNPVTSVIVNLAIVAIVWMGAGLANTGGLEQGQIIALVNYMTQTLLALIVLANIIVIFTKAVASAKRVGEVLALAPEMDAAPQAVAPAQAGREEAPALEFDSVAFTYPGGGSPALENVCLRVGAGRTLGVIGGTGCGKTTLARLVGREYDVSAGAVRLAGRDVRSMPLAQVHRMVGMVPQTARLFSGTVRTNLQMGCQDAADDELWRALETAQAAAFVREKQGLDTPVEEGGKNFSGGQRQRLTIARALAAKPAVLVLDDSASALDYATDAALRRALKTAAQGMTVVLISQRAFAVKDADEILVLDDGRPAGLGTHEELLRTCEVYREICRSQKLTEGGAHEAGLPAQAGQGATHAPAADEKPRPAAGQSPAQQGGGRPRAGAAAGAGAPGWGESAQGASARRAERGAGQ